MPTFNVYITEQTKRLMEQEKQINPKINWSELFKERVEEISARRRARTLALLNLRGDASSNPLVWVPPKRVGTGFETGAEYKETE